MNRMSDITDNISAKVPPMQHLAEGRCHFYMEQKHRFCKQKAMVAPKEENNEATSSNTCSKTIYCVHHAMNCSSSRNTDNDGDNNKRVRISCPIDPSHSIYQDQIEKHKPICPRTTQIQREQSQVYYQSNINRGGHGRHQTPSSSTVDAADTIPQIEVEEDVLHAKLAIRVLQIYQQLFPIPNNNNYCSDEGAIPIESITYEQIYNSIHPLQMNNNNNSIAEDAAALYQSFTDHGIKSGGMKHVLQQSSIISSVRDLLDSNNSNSKNNIMIIDMGAGRGMLGLATAGVINNDRNHNNQRVHLLLVERGSSRSKADGKLRRQQEQQTTTLLDKTTENHPSTIDPNAKNSNDANTSSTTMNMKVDTLSFSRIRCDLAHVQLQLAIDWAFSTATSQDTITFGRTKGGVEEQSNSSGTRSNTDIVVVAKHLCGCGTDYALKSMAIITDQVVPPTDNIANPSNTSRDGCTITSTPSSVKGCVFATCCYGVCNWDDYVGRDTLIDLFQGSLNFGRKEFDILTKWTTGTVLCCCCNNREQHHDHNNSIVASTNDRFGKAMSQLVQRLNLSCGVHGLGRCCQRIIDYGRVVYMREVLRFPYSDVVHFVEESVTPQNALLIGSHSPIVLHGITYQHMHAHKRKLSG